MEDYDKTEHINKHYALMLKYPVQEDWPTASPTPELNAAAARELRRLEREAWDYETRKDMILQRLAEDLDEFAYLDRENVN